MPNNWSVTWRSATSVDPTQAALAGGPQWEGRKPMLTQSLSLNETELNDTILLGSPLGSNVDTVLNTKQAELQILAPTRLLYSYMPVHDSLYLLRNVVTTSRLMYKLRTASCAGSA